MWLCGCVVIDAADNATDVTDSFVDAADNFMTRADVLVDAADNC